MKQRTLGFTIQFATPNSDDCNVRARSDNMGEILRFESQVADLNKRKERGGSYDEPMNLPHRHPCRLRTRESSLDLRRSSQGILRTF